MRFMDEQHLKRSQLGRRQMTDWLRLQGCQANEKRIRSLMGLEAVFPRPRRLGATSSTGCTRFLLRGVKLMRADQVWSSDITCLPLRAGLVYLVAVIDWYSRPHQSLGGQTPWSVYQSAA